jgi:lysophospholipase L1-like esterase
MARFTLSVFASCCALLAQTADPAREIALLEEELAAHIRLLADWGGLNHYGSENAELKPGAAPVILFGDDAFAHWTNTKYLNRGIARQTTPQMLVRFRQDVIELKPKVVVIQGGSHDIAGVMGPATQGTVAENMKSMVELAKLHNIKVILASTTPVCDCHGKTWSAKRTVGKLRGLNEWLEQYAKQSGAHYVDLYTPLLQGRSFKPELTLDGLVPNQAGYAVLAPILETAIQSALAKYP